MVDIASGVTGPVSSTDNAVARWDGAGGGTIQNSGVLIDDSDNVTGVAALSITSFGANWTNAGRTVADLGIVTTVDINGGAIDGVTIGGTSAGAITGTTITAETSVVPDANDGAALGTATVSWSDLFLADGGAITWNNDGRVIKNLTTGWEFSNAAGNAQIIMSSSGAASAIIGKTHQDNANGFFIIGHKARGTVGTPTAAQDGDVMFIFRGHGYDGTSFIEAANMRMLVDGTVSAGSVPGEYSFVIQAIERMVLRSTGDLTLGNGANQPTAGGGKVFVVGDNEADPTMATNTAGFYGKDVAGTVEAFAVDEGGSAAQLTSHDPITGEYYFHDFNLYTGRGRKFKMEKLINVIIQQLGLTKGEFIEEYTFEARDWTENQRLSKIKQEGSEKINKRDAEEAGRKYTKKLFVPKQPPQFLKDAGVKLDLAKL